MRASSPAASRLQLEPGGPANGGRARATPTTGDGATRFTAVAVMAVMRFARGRNKSASRLPVRAVARVDLRTVCKLVRQRCLPSVTHAWHMACCCRALHSRPYMQAQRSRLQPPPRCPDRRQRVAHRLEAAGRAQWCPAECAAPSRTMSLNSKHETADTPACLSPVPDGHRTGMTTRRCARRARVHAEVHVPE